MESQNKVKINVDEIPDAVFDIGCRILKNAILRLFEQPGVKEDYEKWLPTYEEEQRLKGRTPENEQ